MSAASTSILPRVVGCLGVLRQTPVTWEAVLHCVATPGGCAVAHLGPTSFCAGGGAVGEDFIDATLAKRLALTCLPLSRPTTVRDCGWSLPAVWFLRLCSSFPGVFEVASPFLGGLSYTPHFGCSILTLF